MAKYIVNSFFSGIGGFDLGFENQGFKVGYQCEISEFCRLILKQHWPNVYCADDISKVEGSKLPEADIWCAGFPCQDVSLARGSNGREGLKGKNSGLFYDFFNLIEQKLPKVIILENVLGLLNSHEGNDFKIILQYLTKIGYGVSWRVFNSKFFGVPQSRPRVYICAWKDDLNKAAYVLHEIDGSIKNEKSRTQFTTIERNDSLGYAVPSLAYCLAATSGRHTGTDWSRTYVCYYNQVRRLLPSESEGLQGFPIDWTLPKDAVRSSLMDYDSLRYHSIGNAVSVPVVEWIAARIKKMLKKSMAEGDVLSTFSDFKNNSLREHNISIKDHCQIKWNTGGIASDGVAMDCKVFDAPTKKVESNLKDYIFRGKPEAKYFLSPSAARGILRRADGQKRQLFSPLRESLDRLSLTDLAKAI